MDDPVNDPQRKNAPMNKLLDCYTTSDRLTDYVEAELLITEQSAIENYLAQEAKTINNLRVIGCTDLAARLALAPRTIFSLNLL
jgi:hypothetical protein